MEAVPPNSEIRVLTVERFGRAELFSRLRRTRLHGFDRARPYVEASLELTEAIDPARLAPAQRYVLAPGLRRVLALREALLPHGIDILALDGGAWVRTAEDPDEPLPVIPPIVEETHEPGGRTEMLVADGIHRVFVARRLGLGLNAVTVSGISTEWPYYARAEPGGWTAVRELEDLPDGFQKREYREPSRYRALYRDFNEVFPGLQEERRNSNPTFLRP